MSLSKNVSYSNTPKTSKVFYYTVKEKLRYHAENTPSKEACIVYDTSNLEKRSSITCMELYTQACYFARGLRKLGLRQGDIVGIALPNGPTAMVCIFGTQLAGCIPLVFMFVRKDGSDIVDVLKKCETCAAIVTDPGDDNCKWKICCEFIQEILPNGSVKSSQIPTLRYFLSTKSPKGEGVNVLTTERILDIGKEINDTALPDLDPDDIAVILLTSGSTGTRKPVQFTHINIFDFASHKTDTSGITESDVYFNGYVFNWIGGYPSLYLYKGTTRVTCTNFLAFKDLAAIYGFITKAIEREKCTFGLFNVASLLEMVKSTNENTTWAKSLRTIFSGGSPIPASCRDILSFVSEKLFLFYGCTEMGLATALEVDKVKDHEDYNTGSPLPGIEVKITDDNGKILPRNQTGEVYIRHCGQHLCYHNDKMKTEKVLLPSGWYKTDDIGYMNDNAELIVFGRKSDMMIIGDQVVSPSYIELVIQKYPGVQEVVVTAIPDEMLFQQACACIIPRPGYDLSVPMIEECFEMEFLVNDSSRGIVPKYILFFKALPKTATGKTSRPETRKLAKERIDSTAICK